MTQIVKRTSETLAWRLANPADLPASVMLHPKVIAPEQVATLLKQQMTTSMP